MLKDKDGNIVKEIPAIVRDNQGYDLGQKISFDIVIGESSIKGSVHWDEGKSIEAEYEW